MANSKPISFRDALFFIPFGVWFAIKAMGRTALIVPLNEAIPTPEIMMGCIIVLAVREILFGRNDLKSLALCAISALLAYIALHANIRELCDTILIIYFARDMGCKRCIGLCLAISTCVFIATIASVIMGIFPDVAYEAKGWRAARHYCGFGHPNTGSLILLSIFLMWAYMRDDNYGPLDMGATLALALIMYHFTQSRTMLVLTVFFLLIMALRRMLPGRLSTGRAFRFCVVGFIPVVALVTLVLCLAYNSDSSWMQFADKLLSGRLNLANQTFDEYGFSLWHQDVPFGATSGYDKATGEWVERDMHALVDCAYARILIHCGLLFLVASLAICTASMKRLLTQRNWMPIAILSLMALCCVSESAIVLAYNPLLLLLALPFSDDKSGSGACDHATGVRHLWHDLKQGQQREAR